eukprot:CAMPEP_0195650776 /NCGR_PEP_ID=MMETSP0815-20121206/31898_1 /TAXON_ID=97485 /ORGANISM="Prymnesium parvum, Strain Texoma1" /LENGTH=89 /DNA_ID=CAMNT_0040794605 /DNA_START=161 /DNA_END=430 /DNA_ORIENTATION=+
MIFGLRAKKFETLPLMETHETQWRHQDFFPEQEPVSAPSSLCKIPVNEVHNYTCLTASCPPQRRNDCTRNSEVCQALFQEKLGENVLRG